MLTDAVLTIAGEEERFAFKRAVSRVHEMSSAEYLVSTVHAPLDASVRTWERPANSPSLPPLPPARPARHSIGPKALIEEDHNQLSGVLSPSNLRVRFPDGLPVHPQVEVKRDAKPRRGEKPDVINMENDTRGQVSPPVLKNDHVWGVREDWGKGAGAWGKGASVHEKEKK